MADKYTVFTYGSLMRGFDGYDRYMQTSEFISEAELRGDLRFFCSDYPILIHDEKNGKPIRGELFSVDSATMDELRRYEGIKDPFTCYNEKSVKVQTADGEHMAQAFVVIPFLEFPILFFSRHIPERSWRTFVSQGKKLPIPRPLMLFFGACVLGAAIYEALHLMGSV